MQWINSYQSMIGRIQSASFGQNGNVANHSSGVDFADILGTRLNAESHIENNPNILSSETIKLLTMILTRHLGGQIPSTTTWLNNYMASMPLRFAPPAPQPVPEMSKHTVSPIVPLASPPPTDFTSLINKAASRYQLDPSLIHAVIETESNFNSRAVSNAGAQGLMQLMPQTASELKVADPLDPAQNIDGGSRYLARLVERYHGDTKLALAAYNWGMGNLERQPENMPEETKNYVVKVMDRWNRKRTELA